MLAYAMVTAIIFLVMGTVGFFYCIDALYADRADRSVLFWKSLPLSDAETVLSKFATAAVLIPLVAEICVEVDPAARRIRVAAPEGLLELNAD